jgi:hypothetical protein
MAKVGYVDVTPAVDDAYFKYLQPSDRFVFSRIIKKQTLFSYKKKKGLSQKSLLPQVAEVWATFSPEEKALWATVASYSNLTGWRLFVQDQCLRIVNDMEGSAVPSELHQSHVGLVHIEAPASEAKIVQYHPHFYYVSKKVPKTKSQYAPVLVNEDFTLPLTISLNYSSDLTSVAEGSFAKFYAHVWHSYQGADRETDLTIDLDPQSGWTSGEATLTDVLGYVVRYDLYFHFSGLQGEFYFDNVSAEHSAQNWVRDPFCKDINQGFTRAFYQIPKHWAGVILPEGSYFESIYKDFD